VGFAAKNRGRIGEDRAVASERLVTLRHELSETETKLKALGTPRPATVMEGLLRGQEQDRRWVSSKECRDATADASRSFCKDYFDLKAEAALAGEASRHEVRLAGLRSQVRGLEEQGAGRQGDSQAAVLANLLGLQTVQVERGLMFFFAVLVEVGAALGLYFATGHLRFDGHAPRGSGPIIEGRTLTAVPPGKPFPPAKQLPPSTRRVPRLKQNAD
jgi:hypothetical protein